ncbi:MAG: spermidine synthase [Ancrocorticia sp.]|uniref:spermidine synthase n=1 Tax=Ancrocorticia sp. TaxID=2593684 RepID=UPI003F910643
MTRSKNTRQKQPDRTRGENPLDRLPSEPVSTDFSIAEIGQSPYRPSLITLYLDGAESSALDLDDPRYLEFEYMQHIDLIIGATLGDTVPLRALHLGGAGCALARAMDAGHPGSKQLAIELDRQLARDVREWFDLPPAPRLRIRNDEARHALDTTKARWDVVIRDAFRVREVPLQLRTSECVKRAHEVLSPGGLYIMNSIASTGFTRLGEEIATVAEHFPHIMAIVDPSILKGRRFGNIVIAASDHEFPLGEISKRVRRLSLPASVLDTPSLLRKASGSKVFNDDELQPGILWSSSVQG